MFEEKEMPKTLLEAINYFANKDVCREYLAHLRWPNGIACPRHGCGSTDVHFIPTRKIWRCNDCKRQFSVTVGTIFEDSHIGLDKWLPAVWMLSSSKKGVSSYQTARQLGIAQKTAWYMNHRIRLAMQNGSLDQPLTREVEVDETYVGGKETNKHKGKKLNQGRGTVGKTPVMGLVQRNGKVRAMVVDNTRANTLIQKVKENVELGSAVYTDALASYAGLEADYLHEMVDHTENYVNGWVHTNCMENFWSLFKRNLYGTYQAVDKKNLNRYVDEVGYRYNERGKDDPERFEQTVEQFEGKRLTYKQLTEKLAVM